MADKLISALTPAASAANADELVLNQDAGGGTFNTKRIAVSAFKSSLGFVSSGGALGTPSSGTLTNCSGLPLAGVSGLGTNVATALGVNVGTDGAFVVKGGALGTPNSGTLSNCQIPLSGITGLATGVSTALAVNVGSAGAFVVNGGALGTPSGGDGSNITNVNAATLGGATFAAPGAIGGGTPAAGAFTTLAGTTGTFTDAVSTSKSVAGAFAGLSVRNTSNNSAAYALLGLGNDTAANRGFLAMTSSTYAQPDRLQVYCAGGGGLELGTSANAPVYFYQNNSEAGRFDTNRYLLLGYTSSQGSYKLQVNGAAYVSGQLYVPSDRINASYGIRSGGSTGSASAGTAFFLFNGFGTLGGTVHVHALSTSSCASCTFAGDNGGGLSRITMQGYGGSNVATFITSGSGIYIVFNSATTFWWSYTANPGGA